MPFTNEYSNVINPTEIVLDVASENLKNVKPVWRQHVARIPMTVLAELKKRGELHRLALPENSQYTFGAYSQYKETSIYVSPMKHACISKVTLEDEKFSQESTPQKIGEEQGKAFAKGAEEDISALVSSFTSTTGAPGGALVQEDVHAAALEVMTNTNDTIDRVVGVFSLKSASEFLVNEVLNSTTGTLAAFSNSAHSSAMGADNFSNNFSAAGFVTNLGGIDIYRTPTVDVVSSHYQNCIFAPEKAFAGMWDDSLYSLSESDILYFRTLYGTAFFSGFAIHWDEAGCIVPGQI